MSKRKIILETTLDIISEVGIQGTTLPGIIKKSGVATGTIYYYFKDKDELIESLYLEVKEEAGAALAENLEQGIPFKERFFKLWKNLYSFYINNPKKFELLEDYANSPLVKNEIKAITILYIKRAVDFIKVGQESGILRNMPVNLMVALVFKNVATYTRMVLLNELEPTSDLLNETIQASWDSIRIN